VHSDLYITTESARGRARKIERERNEYIQTQQKVVHTQRPHSSMSSWTSSKVHTDQTATDINHSINAHKCAQTRTRTRTHAHTSYYLVSMWYFASRVKMLCLAPAQSRQRHSYHHNQCAHNPARVVSAKSRRFHCAALQGAHDLRQRDIYYKERKVFFKSLASGKGTLAVIAY